MKFRIENIPPHQIAFIRNVGPYGIGNLATMEKLKEWAKSNDLLNAESILYGIAHDNPEQTRPEDCRYDTCIALKTKIPKDNTIQLSNIAGGRYAIFPIPHTAEAVQHAWQEVFPLLVKLKYHMDATRPVLERYKAQLVMNHQCEICVPIL